jgi:regulator of protease activity HflC (stomatin/prohibitin superfamily)
MTGIEITNIDFDDAFEKAVEDKVVAVQRAIEAKNKTVQIQEEANQQIISAKAEAQSMSIRAQALSQNKSLVEWEAVQKWNGELPTNMFGSSVPFINMATK